MDRHRDAACDSPAAAGPGPLASNNEDEDEEGKREVDGQH